VRLRIGGHALELQRDADFEERALAGVASGRDVAIVGFDNLAGDRHPPPVWRDRTSSTR